MLDLTRSILVWREPVTARSRTICSCTKMVSSLTLTISSWVVFRSSSNLVTLSAKSMRALLPLRLSWVTPAARIGKAIDASMTRTTSTFPAVDIGSLLPRSQREEGRRNRTCQAQDNARKNLSTARRLFWEPRAMNGYLSDRVQVTLIYLPFQSPANRSLRVPTVSLKRPTKTKQATNADARKARFHRRGPIEDSLRALATKTRMGRHVRAWWRRPQARKEHSSPTLPSPGGLTPNL